MSATSSTYTYRQGEKIALDKQPDQLVVRLPADSVVALGLPQAQPVSNRATRVTLPESDLEDAMVRLRKVAPTHHAYTVAETGDEFLITDRVIVTFKSPIPNADLDEFMGRWALTLLERYSDREFLFQVTDHTGMNPVKLVVALTEQDDRVETAENDVNHRAARAMPFIPNDPHYTRQWYLHTHFTDAQYDPRSCSRAEDAWQVLGGFGSADVVVGVTDDGCKLDHSDFDSPNKFAGWGYFQGTRLVTSSDVDANPGRMYTAGENHGTSCAGVIAGEADALLTVGAAPGCRLLPIKWELSDGYLLTTDSKLLSALNYLVDRVDVVSNSWGRVPTALYATAVVTRLTELSLSGGRRGKGIVFLWAAGNENCPIQYNAPVNVPYTDGWRQGAGGNWNWVGPSTAKNFRNNLVDIPGVVHVAAVASNAQRSHYSNYGPGVVLSAPSSNSHAYYRASVPGLGVTTATGGAGLVTHSFGGTSSATPLAAAIAALVISANPQLSALDVIAILKQTASKALNLTGYGRTPAASFDATPTWDVSPIAPFDRGDFQDIGATEGAWSPWFGFGRVDAHAAVVEALQRAGGTVQPDALNVASQPRIAIPDDNQTGARDVINVSNRGRVREIMVTVDITHSWIGDLRVRLIAPNGTAITLHDRAGNSADNIRTTFDRTNTPALAGLLNQPAAGDWTLQVQDLARHDSGSLNAWTLIMKVVPGPAEVVDIAAVRIPDNNPQGVVRVIDIAPGSPIADVAVSVDITHPYVPDLRITLTPPDQAPIALAPGYVTSFGHLLRTWRAADLPALAALQGANPGGEWKLHVRDVARLDEGKLNSWKLELTA